MRGQMPKARQRTFDGECGEKKKKQKKNSQMRQMPALGSHDDVP